MMEDLSIKDLGTFVHLCMKADHLDTAQIYLNEMQTRVTAAKPSPQVTSPLDEGIIDHEGPPRDDQGNITRISTQISDPGYDPGIHENLELKILCDGVHFPTAHTADIVAGTIWCYEKNAQGRIKTLTKHGKVEICGL